MDQLGSMRLRLLSLLVSSLLLSASLCSEPPGDKSDQDEEVIVVHDTWEKGDNEEVGVEDGRDRKELQLEP